jgi:glycosyltransferase 2 family protein
MSVGRAARLVMLAATAATAVALAFRLDERRVLAAFVGVDWAWVAVAAIVNVGNTVIESWRWMQVASPLAPTVRLRSAFLAIVSGIAGGLLLPFKLGDGVKAVVFARAERLRVSQAVGTVVADRLADLLAFAIIALAAWWTVSLPGRVGTVVHYVSGGLAVSLALVVGLATAGPLRRWLQSEGRPRLAARTGRGLDTLARFGRTVPVWRVAVASFASWLARAGVVWAMMQAFHLALPPVAALIALIVVNVGIAVAGVPGNVGSFELAAVGALGLYSVPVETGVSYALALHATELLPLLALGAALALTGVIDIGSWPTARAPQPDAGSVSE